MPTPLPDWLSPPDPNPSPPSTPSNGKKALLLAQFEMVFPRVLEGMYEGRTLNSIVNSLPIPIPLGVFTRWVTKDPTRLALYKEAKEVRTEAWAGKIINHAEGSEDGFENDTARSALIVNTYKWLMSAENRKQYGESKTIEMNTTISITAALNQATQRALGTTSDDIDLIDSPSYYQMDDQGDSSNIEDID